MNKSEFCALVDRHRELYERASSVDKFLTKTLESEFHTNIALAVAAPWEILFIDTLKYLYKEPEVAKDLLEYYFYEALMMSEGGHIEVGSKKYKIRNSADLYEYCLSMDMFK